MSETTVICSKCGEHVPKKRFCGECGEPLAITNQPTATQQGQVSTPVQVADSGSLNIGDEGVGGQSSDAGNGPPTLPPTTVSGHPGSPNEETNVTPSSYAEAARSNVSDAQNTSSQQNNQGTLPNTGPAGSIGHTQKLNVIASKNGGTAANANGGASVTNKKVLSVIIFNALTLLIGYRAYNLCLNSLAWPDPL